MSYCYHDTTHSMSEICLNSWQDGYLNQTLQMQCVPTIVYPGVLQIHVILCAINSIVGVCGNLLTLLAIPFAASRKLFRLHRNWPRTHFILNLAFADLLMCGIGFPFQIFVYFHRSWEWGIRSCQIMANILHIIYYSEWFSVAMVAATCCITITKPRGLYSFFMKRSNRIIVILSIWSLGFTLLLPTNLQVFDEFGFDCRSGICDFISNRDNQPPQNADLVLNSIAFLSTSVIIISSYTYIWFYVWNNHKYLKRHGESSTRKILSQKETRTQWALCLVCFSFFIFVMPSEICAYTLYLKEDFTLSNMYFCYAALYLYSHQYSLNFLVYCARCENYRKAYIYFFRKVKESILNLTNPNFEVRSTNSVLIQLQNSRRQSHPANSQLTVSNTNTIHPHKNREKSLSNGSAKLSEPLVSIVLTNRPEIVTRASIVNAEVHTHSDGCTNICLKEGGLDDLPVDVLHCQDSTSGSDDESQ